MKSTAINIFSSHTFQLGLGSYIWIFASQNQQNCATLKDKD